ncbi:MAG: hypothetical protein ACI92S_005468, partial [Planctomycetaceae bacterium]
AGLTKAAIELDEYKNRDAARERHTSFALGVC